MVDVHIDVYFTPGGRRGQTLEGPLSVVPKPISELNVLSLIFAVFFRYTRSTHLSNAPT